ncbi:UNVERIFIED_CONTAM: hypothetical protein GTU68_034025 [Idotea baltica]|nr:hypothetical protein [Idotea baltica]
MNNNDILRRVRYIFDFNDDSMMEIFELAEHPMTRAEISDWLKKDTDAAFVPLSDFHLATFLNGLINSKRGKRDGPQPPAERKLNNNIVFRKLKIALNYKDEDILAIYDLVDVEISKHELSAFFRKPSQSQYRACLRQYLRNFLLGLQKKMRPDSKE